jgi:hypothetical protein
MNKVMTKTKVVAAGVAVMAVFAAYAAYQYNQSRSGNVDSKPAGSLQSGIAQTKQAIQQIDRQIDDNQTDGLKLFSGLLVDLGGALGKLGAGSGSGTEGLRSALEALQRDPLNTSKAMIEQFQFSSGATSSLRDGHYLQALGQGAKSIGQLWALLAATPAMGFSLAVEDVLYKSVETATILTQQAHLVDVRQKLEQQLFRLEGKDPQSIAEWDRVFQNLFGDPGAYHQAFLQATAKLQADKQELANKALRDAASRSDASAFQVAQGLTIIDPDTHLWDLDNWPGINPDFIDALNRCNQAVRQMNGGLQDLSALPPCPPDKVCPLNEAAGQRIKAGVYLGHVCNHYGDGSYIPAFGPSKGGGPNAIPANSAGGTLTTDGATISYAPGRPGVEIDWPVPAPSDIPSLRFCKDTVPPYYDSRAGDCYLLDQHQHVDIPPGKYLLSIGFGIRQGDAKGSPVTDDPSASNLLSTRGFQPLKVSIPDGMAAHVSVPVGVVQFHRKAVQGAGVWFDIFDATGKTNLCGLCGWGSPPFTGDIDRSVGMAPGIYLMQLTRWSPKLIKESPVKFSVSAGQTTDVNLQ